MKNTHIQMDRLQAFLLEGLKLEEAETAHLLVCKRCMEGMSEAVGRDFFSDPASNRRKDKPPTAA